MTRRRTVAVRRAAAADFLARRTKLEILLARSDRLTLAEADELRALVHVEVDTADQLRTKSRAQDRALQVLRDRVAAAEAALVETERDRDQLAHYLVAAKRAAGAETVVDTPAAIRALAAAQDEARSHPEEP
ncbi:hypothetical protein ACH4OX_24420 [Streptomyces roseolus]|uniref:hypothetical protein n=1 Tax=Streptomyces roseolus TaxID=67358 RepID=UPI0037B2A3B5